MGAQRPLSPLEEEIFSSIIYLGGYDLTLRYPNLQGNSPLLIFLPNAEESGLIKYLPDFEYLYPFGRHSPSKAEVMQSCTKFFNAFGSKIFLGWAPKFQDVCYQKNILPIMVQNFAVII